MVVLGRDAETDGETVDLGWFRAPDGSRGARVELDCEFPHAALVVGKRGYGKSYTLGVLAEGLARAAGVAPVLADPMGVFGTLENGTVPATVIDEPRVAPASIPPDAWCSMLGLAPDSGAGALLWRAATGATSLEMMYDRVAELDCDPVARRAVGNHLALVESWDVFDPAGLDAATLGTGEVTVLDCSGLPEPAMNAVVRGVATVLYEARIGAQTRGRHGVRSDPPVSRLPWLLVDEAHVFFDGVAAPALRTLLTRGRQPGVSLVTATQRPDVLPDVAVSQSDLVVAHRLTDRADRAALERVVPVEAQEPSSTMPLRPGEVTVVDDAAESVHAVCVRARETPHGGSSPRASDVSTDRYLK
ncbi:ATP-binding protein [Haloarchaeobius sp. TZWWS8]|uniref:ATP-binding protein n=1 Tax=Haloarchaeobius sp. TZWWS8 TaxID=3446121 RepID=UPI003EBA699D